MALNYTQLVLRPNYRIHGTDAVLEGFADPIRVIDKTDGATLPGPIEIETTRPAATFMCADLIALDIDLDAGLDLLTLQMNGRNWKIRSSKVFPSPGGYNDGEVYAFLEEVS